MPHFPFLLSPILALVPRGVFTFGFRSEKEVMGARIIKKEGLSSITFYTTIF